MVDAIDADLKRMIPTLKGLSNSEIDARFEDFFSKADIVMMEKNHNKSFTAERKELMKKSFIKNDGYPDPFDFWPEDYPRKIG